MATLLPRCAVCRTTIEAGTSVIFRSDGRVHAIGGAVSSQFDAASDLEAPVEKTIPTQALVPDETDRPRACHLEHNDIDIGDVIRDQEDAALFREIHETARADPVQNFRHQIRDDFQMQREISSPAKNGIGHGGKGYACERAGDSKRMSSNSRSLKHRCKPAPPPCG